MDEEKILQIIPATDWYVVYTGEGDDRGLELFSRLACWALVEEDGVGLGGRQYQSRHVEGIDSEGDLATSAGNFKEYRYSSTPLPAFRKVMEQGGKHECEFHSACCDAPPAEGNRCGRCGDPSGFDCGCGKPCGQCDDCSGVKDEMD